MGRMEDSTSLTVLLWEEEVVESAENWGEFQALIDSVTTLDCLESLPTAYSFSLGSIYFFSNFA